MCGVTWLDRNRSKYIKARLGVTNLVGKMRDNILRWFGNVEKRNN